MNAATMSLPTNDELYEAYIYLLARALVVRQERIDTSEDDLGYNAIKYNPVGSASFVNPNFDVANLEAWIAVDESNPAVLTIPKIEGRYYTAQIIDEWGEVIANLNERTFPNHPYGDFVFYAPGAPVPEGHGMPIELHGKKAKMLGRVELKGDTEGAVALQHEFKLHSLGSPNIAPIISLPSFTNAELIGVEMFQHASELLDSARDPMEGVAELQKRCREVEELCEASSEARDEIDTTIKKFIPKAIKEFNTKVAPVVHGWLGGGVIGHYGTEYRLRTAADYIGIWANTTAEVVYYIAVADADGEHLVGANDYSITFPADSLPQDQVDAYWSVALVSMPAYMAIPNKLNRYSLNSYSGLKKEDDGSLRIDMTPEPVEGRPIENWLPSSADEGFSLTFRLYRPKEGVPGTWFPPAVVKG